MELEEIFTNSTARVGDIAPMPKAILVFAHPDDETIALGARMGRFGAAHLIHATDGAPRNQQDSRAHGFASWREYRQARADELANALRVAGVANMSRECLGVADQQASLELANLTLKLISRMEKFRPEVVFTHPYEGGHPDHDACAFAVHHAAEMLRAECGQVPLIVEAPFYHAGPRGFQAGEFLSPPERVPDVAYALMREEQSRKREMLACFTTQQETLRGFGCDWERYRVAPQYDFRRPPHAGSVLYDGFPWGMSSALFGELAGQAEGELRQEMVSACR